jgi:hypothetical protein
MTSTTTEGPHMISGSVEDEHEELLAGIDHIHELAERDRNPEFGLLASEVAGRVDGWGFLVHPDLPDGPGPSFLLVALRPVPTLHHYDPEAVDYWVTQGGRGERRTLTHETHMPRSEEYSWGLIRLVDRLQISNEYLTFGGHLDAALIDDVVIAAFASPAPLLRRGGHSQGWDQGADAIGGFFARMMVAVDFEPGFEALFADAAPLTRYAAFVRDTDQRRRPARTSTWGDDDLGRLIRHEATRLRATAPEQWEAAGALLNAGILA